jgi:hypothetical protein
MRYFLDTEYNGYGGALISLALAPEYGDQEYYAVLPPPDPVHPWVERHVLPYLETNAEPSRLGPREAGEAMADYLTGDPEAVIVADWPDDILHFCSLLTTGPGEIVEVGEIRFQLLSTPGFSTAANSKVPHNALHDARALRTFVLEQEELLAPAKRRGFPCHS